MKGSAATTIAGCFALAALSVAVVAGLCGGNPAAAVLMRALIAMVVCYPVGFGVGLIAQRLIREHVDAHRSANPALDLSDGGAATGTDER